MIDAVKAVTDLNGDVVAANDTLEYTITLRNTGSVDATNIVFTDAIPANTTYVENSSKLNSVAAGSVSDGVLTVDVGDLAVNVTATIKFQVTVDAGTPTGTVISNQGSVDSDQTVPEPTDVDGNDSNGDQPTDVTVGQPISGGGGALYARKTVDVASVATGDTVTYIITLENTGSTELTNLQFSDTVPAPIAVTDATATSAGITVSHSGQLVTARLASLAPSTSATLTITGTAGATGTVNNQGAVTYTDASTPRTTQTDFDGLPGNGNQPTPVTIVSGTDPQLDVQKRWSLLTDTAPLGVPSPGDTLLYTTAMRNVGGAIAENVRFSDPVPTHTTLVPNSVVTSQGAVTSANASPVSVNLGTLAAGASATVSFRVTIAGGTTNGTVLSNQATVTRTGDTTGVASDDNGDSGDGRNPTLTPVYTEAPTPVLGKTQAASSETASGGATVLIGEVVTFELAFSVPPGTTRELTFADTLPSGLAYVDDSARLRRTSTKLNAALNPGGINSATADDPVTLVDDVHLLTSGQTLSLALGNVTNSDAAEGTTEQYILQYRARVQNLAGNAKGATLTNSATIRTLNTLGVEQSLTPQAVALAIIEPSLTLDKSVDPAALLSTGGATTYTLVVTNTGNAPAYDVCITDPLSADWTLGTVTATPSATDAPTGITVKQDAAADDCGSDRLRVQVDDFPAGGVLTLRIPVSDTDLSSAPNDQLNNTAITTWTSLPGATGSGTGLDAAGTAGTENGERTGTGTGVNLYTVSDTAQVTINALNLTKTVDTTRRYAIGELATYRLDISVPAGYSVTDAVITDALPSGLLYVGPVRRVDTNTALTNTTLTANASGTPPTLTISLGTLSNSAATAQTLSLDYAVRVDNVAGNQFDTAPLTNTATLAFKDPRDGNAAKTRSDTASLQLGEPQLSLTLAAAGPGGALTDLQAGDLITYSLTLSNASGAGVTTAFDSLLSSVLPSGLTGVTDSLVNTASSNLSAEALTALLATLSVDADGLTTAEDGFDLPPGASVTLTFQATLDAGVLSGETLPATTASVTYTSLDGADATERTGSGEPAVNDYQASDSAQTLTIDSTVAFDKRFLPDTRTTFAVGEQVTYRLRVDLIEGTTNDLVLTDTLPAGLSYVGYSLGAGSGASMTIPFDPATDLTVTPATGPSDTGQVVVFELGTVINTANGQRDDDYLTIDLTARVDNVIANQAVTVLGNHARLEYVDAGGAKTLDFDADSETAGIQPLDLTVVEPTVTLGLTQSVESLSLGDLVTYTLTLSASDATAYGVQLIDTLPAGLAFVSATGGTPSVSGQTLTFDLAQLAHGDSHQITITARLRAETAVGATQQNQATLTWGSMPNATGAADSGRTGSNGAGEGLNNYATSQAVSLAPTTNAVIDASKAVAFAPGGDGNSDGQADPGDTLEYRVVLTNNGSVDATNVVFTDPLPVNTTYVPGSTRRNGTSLADSGGALSVTDEVLRLELGTLEAAGANPATILFQVRIDDAVPSGTLIRNQGVVDSAQTVPEPTDVDGNDSNGDQPTDIRVGGSGSLDNALYVEKVVTWSQDSESDGAVTPGDTLTYTLVVSNRGDAELTNVSLTDSIPDGLTYVADSAQIQGATVDVDGSSLSVTIPKLAAGDFEFVSFAVTIDAFDASASPKTFTNQATADSDQTEVVRSDGNGNPSDGNQPTSITAVSDGSTGAPALDVEKRWSLVVDADGDGRVDPGDTLAYSIRVQNSGSAPAPDLRLSDAIPDNTSLVAGSVTSSQGAVVSTSDPITVNLGNLGAGALATIGFRVTVDVGTAGGTLIANQATVTAAGDISELSDDNGSDSDGKNPTLTPVDDGVTAAPSGLAKTLFASSESASSGTELMIGEVATFQVTVEIPPGTLSQATLSDTLPAGLTYVDGTARLARTFETGLVAERDPGDINGSASGVFVDLVDDSDLAIGGQTLSLALGDLINSDRDTNAETYTLEYQAVVANIASNQAGTALSNSATLGYLDALEQPRTLTPVARQLTVREPAVAITKAVSPGGVGQFGGEVTFTLTLTNPSSSGHVATAYDLQVLDTLPATYSGWTLVSTTPSGGLTADAVTNNATATTLDIRVAALPPDASLTILYRATAPAGLVVANITNTASVTWTSLPGDQGTGDAAPGEPGTADGERTGSGVGANDFSDADAAVVSVGDVSFTKAIVAAQTRYAIGETLSFALTLDLPPGGVLTSALISDQLAAGLTYVGGSLEIARDTGVTVSGTAADFSRQDNTPTAGLETLTLALGTVTNASSTAAGVTLTYQTRVDNLLGNQDNQALTNAAALTFDDPLGGATRRFADDTSLVVGEPKLTLAKTISSATTNLQAGDQVDFQVVVTNSGNTTAHDVVLTDPLPDGLAAVSDLRLTAATGGAGMPTFSNGGTQWQSTPFALPVGASLTLAFSATLTDRVIPDQVLQNRVSAAFSSLAGDSAAERDGSDAGSQQTDDSVLNNYNSSALSPSISVANPVQLDKAFHPEPTQTQYRIGETLGYRLRVDLIEGTTRDLLVTDTLPEGLRFVRASLGSGNLGISSEYGGAPSQNGQTLSFDLGELVNPANGERGDDFITLDIAAVVEDVATNVDGARLGNQASVSYTTAGGTDTLAFDADAEEPGTQPLGLEILEPRLALTKTLDVAEVAQGEEVRFTLRLGHTAASRADAYDLRITDRLPAGLSYVPGSATLTPTLDGDTLLFAIDALTLADQAVEISFRARVDEDAQVGQTLTNGAEAVWDSGPGENPDARDDEAAASVDLQVRAAERTIDLSLQKSVSPYAASVGAQASFRLVLANAGPDRATAIEVTDALPSGLRYLEHWGDGAFDPTTGIWSLTELAAGAEAILQITVVVEAVGEFSNSAQVTAAGGVDVDSTPGNDDGDQSEDDEARVLLSGSALTADLSLRKRVSETSPRVGDWVTFTLGLRNGGPLAATGVAVADRLPPGLAELTDISDGGSVSGSVISWRNLAVAVGETRELSFRARVLETGPYRNVAEIIAADQGDLDSSPNNDDGDQSEDDEDFVALVPWQPDHIDLSLEKRVSVREPNVGDRVTYQLTLRNAGPGAATGVTLVDQVPDGLGTPTNISGGGTFATGELRWSGLRLAAGASLVLSYDAEVLANDRGDYRNTAQVAAADQYDLDSKPGNDNGDQSEDDEASAAILPVDQPPPPPAIAKRFDPPVIDLGEHARLVVTLINATDSVMTLNEDLVDTFPPGLWIDHLPNLGGTCPTTPLGVASGGIVVYPKGAQIPVGNCDIWVDVTGDGGTHINSIGVGLLVTDGGSNEEPATSEILVDPADVRVVKTLAPPANPAIGYLPGELLTFSIAVSNQGPDPGQNVRIEDQLTNLTLQSVSGACSALPCVLPSLAVGESRSITVTALLPTSASRGDTFGNLASAHADSPPDPDPSNNSDSVEGSVGGYQPMAIPTLNVWLIAVLGLLLLVLGGARLRVSRGG